MPLRVSPAALLNITAKRPMPSRSERLAYFLAFLASYQYIQLLTSFLVGLVLVIGKVNPAICFGDFFCTPLLTKQIVRHHFDLLRFNHVVVRFL